METTVAMAALMSVSTFALFLNALKGFLSLVTIAAMTHQEMRAMEIKLVVNLTQMLIAQLVMACFDNLQTVLKCAGLC